MIDRKNYILNILKQCSFDSGAYRPIAHAGSLARAGLIFSPDGGTRPDPSGEREEEPVALGGEERRRHYRICHAIAKQLDLYPKMRRFMKKRRQAASMRELPDGALRLLLQYMRSLEGEIASRR